ncbi:MAG: Hpt domain-containing protein [Planctomycetota bacterium]|nr:Hpt domain-containing protein [Planctomycetota bacterium]
MDPDSVVDWCAAAQTTPGGPETVIELAGLMQELCPQMLGKIHAGLEADDAAEVRLAAHTLKGAARHLVAAELAAAAEVVESRAAAGDLRTAQEAVPALESAIGRVTAEIERLQGS